MRLSLVRTVEIIGEVHLHLPLPEAGLDVDHQVGVDLLLVLQPVAPAFHVHLLGVRVVEPG